MGPLESAGNAKFPRGNSEYRRSETGTRIDTNLSGGWQFCQPPLSLEEVIAEHIEVSSGRHGHPDIMAIFKFTFDAGSVPLGFRHVVMARAVDPVSESEVRVQST